LKKDCFYDETIQDYIFNVENEEMNNREKISERRDYFEKRALEFAEKNSKVRRKSSADWIESVISHNNYDLSSLEVSDILQRITEQTRIPQSYSDRNFALDNVYNEYIAGSEDNSTMPEATPEPEL
jgi:hypothetical protein